MIHDSDDDETLLEFLTRNLPGLVFHVKVDMNGALHLKFMCREAERILGLNPMDIERDPSMLWERIPPDDRPEIQALLQQIRKAEQKVQREVCIRLPDGRDRWLRVEATPRKRRHENGTEWFGVALDVTEAQRQKREIEDAHSLLEGVLSSVEDAIFVIGPPNRQVVKSANKAVEKVFGYRPGELEGSTTEILHESRESFEEFGRRTEKVLETGKTYRGKYRMRRRNGEIFPTEHIITIMHPKAGWQGGVVSVVRDITAQQSAKRKLLESEQKYRNLVEHSSQGILVVQNDRLAFVNPFAARAMGYAQEEMVDQPYRSFVHPDDLDKAAQRVQKALSGEQIAQNYELRLLRKDGNIIWVLSNAVLIEWKGKPAFMAFQTDITKLKALERENKEFEKKVQMTQKMEAIGTLAGGIAHDFNNILSSIIGFTELSLDEVEKDTSIEANLKQVFAAGIRAKNLVQQILTLSRRDEQDIKPIYLRPLIKEALKMLRSTIPSSIEFRESICNDPLVVNADPTQIHQVIVNLATNAKQAMADATGVLEVSVDAVSLGPDIKSRYPDLKPGDYARVTVSDTGIGISNEDLEKIFEPYFTTKKKGEGTGLGLSVVHGIIKSHEGHIAVYSELGKGTTLYVYLPLVKMASIEFPVKEAKPLPTGSERILFVDDELPIVNLQRNILERLGYTVTARTSSVEALEAFRASPHKFDLIITDMTMPNMTGEKLAHEIKAIRSDIPVILCTGFSEQISDRDENVDIDRLLMKPVDREKMAIQIRTVIDAANARRRE